MNLRQLIREIVEATQTTHSVEREVQRLSIDEFTVGYETTKGQYQKVGTYNLPPLAKDTMKNNLEKLKNINFPKKNRFAVLLLKAQINPNLVNYFSDIHKEEIKNKKLIFVGVGETPGREGANGDALYAIIENDKIITIFWKKSYFTKDTLIHQLAVDRLFDHPDSISFITQNTNQTTKQENIVQIDGTKWIVDKDKHVLYKKNKPEITIPIDKAFETLPEDIQEKILNFL